MNCVSCDICVYHLGLFVFFPGVFLSSRVTGACPVTTDLTMRVNVRTTTTTTTTTTGWFALKTAMYCPVNVQAVFSIQTVKFCSCLLCTLAKTSPHFFFHFFCLIFRK